LALGKDEKLKIELMLYGVRLSTAYKKSFKRYVYKRASLSEGVCFRLGKGYVNVPVFEKFVQNSPFYYDENKRMILKNGVPLVPSIAVEDPEWYNWKIDGRQLQELIQMHSPGVITTAISNVCVFKTRGKGCLFCALDSGKIIKRKPEEVARAITFLDENGVFVRDININSGTLSETDAGIEEYVEFAMAIRKVSNIPLYAQLCPPELTPDILRLKDAGIDSVSFNIEIFDENIRKRICPGKSSIPVRKYLETLENAVRVFGEGQVSSWLIIGLEPFSSTIAGIKEIAKTGAIPYPTIFRPLTGTPFENYEIPEVEDVLNVYEELYNTISCFKSTPISKAGCVNCNCCSVLEQVLE